MKYWYPKRANNFLENVRFAFSLCLDAHRKLFSGIILVPFILSLLPAASALIARNLINSVVELSTTASTDIASLQLWIGLGFLITMLMTISQLLNFFLTKNFKEKLEHSLTLGIMSHATTLDFSSFEDPQFQDIFSRVRKGKGEQLLVFVSMVIKMVTNGIQTISLLLILFVIEPLLLWLLVPLCLPYLLFQMWLSKKRFLLEESQVTKQRWMRYYIGRLTSDSSIAEVRILNLAPLFLERVQKTLHTFRADNQRIYWLHLFGSGLFAILSVSAVYFVLYRVAIGVIDGGLSVGDVAIYGGAASALRTTLDSTMNAVGQIRWKILQISALRQFFALQPLVSHSDEVIPTVKQGEIRLDNLHFTYPGTNEPVLAGISLHIKEGETVAIVGPNGAGKTTLVKLLARFYEPSSGMIWFDSVALNQIPRQYLYRQIAYVFQDFGCYEATVADNIAFGNWEELLDNSQKVTQIAERVGIHSLINEMPQGYETRLGRQFGESTLSGGQWQQIAIARAFARDASLLILDEPTSNLDVQSEYRLFSQFKELSKGRTTILISHRFSTVCMADRILVMDKGRIVENGTHDALMAQKGQYAALYELHHRQIENKFDHDVEGNHAQ